MTPKDFLKKLKKHIQDRESWSEEFIKIKPVIQELKNKMDNKEITFQDFKNKFNTKCSEDQIKNLLLLNEFF